MFLPATAMRVTVTPSSSSVGVTVVTSLGIATEHNETEDVDAKASDANVKQKIDVVDLFRADESSDSIREDREAEGDQKDGVDEGAEYLRTNPTVRIIRRIPVGYLNQNTTETFYIIHKLNDALLDFYLKKTSKIPTLFLNY